MLINDKPDGSKKAVLINRVALAAEAADQADGDQQCISLSAASC